MAGSSKLCSICNKNITKSEFKLQCGTCKKWFHPRCTGTNEVEVKVLLQSKNSWFCQTCSPDRNSGVNDNKRNSSSFLPTRQSLSGFNTNNASMQGNQPISEDFHSLKQLILDIKDSNLALRSEIIEVKNSLTFLNQMYEEERTRNRVMGEMLEDIKKENSFLKDEVARIKSQLNVEETQNHRNKIVITGICDNPKEEIEMLKRKIGQVTSYIDPDFPQNCVGDIKIKTSKNGKQIVIAALDSVETKISLLKKRTKKGKLTPEGCGLAPSATNKLIFLNEFMTPMSYSLLMEAIKLKNVGYQFVWHRSGLVYARFKEGEEAIKIRDRQHINQIIEAR